MNRERYGKIIRLFKYVYAEREIFSSQTSNYSTKNGFFIGNAQKSIKSLSLLFKNVSYLDYKVRDAEWTIGLERVPRVCMQLKV